MATKISKTPFSLKPIKLPQTLATIKVSDSAIAQVLRVYISRTHQSTKKVKTRSEVRGSTRKIYKQKGTGNARHGAITAPIFVGGGITHGPSGVVAGKLKLNKKLKNKVLAVLLGKKASSKDLFTITPPKLISPSTATLHKTLKSHLLGGKALFVYSSSINIKNTILSIRNLEKISILPVAKLNTLHLSRFKKIIFTQDSLNVLLNRINKSLKLI